MEIKCKGVRPLDRLDRVLHIALIAQQAPLSVVGGQWISLKNIKISILIGSCFNFVIIKLIPQG